MRLAAAKSGKQGSAYSPIAVKKVEMTALIDHGGLFVEILISRTPSAPYRYEFKASAKEVKTGAIAANATSLRWRQERLRRLQRVVATSRGYRLRDAGIPPIHEISASLALDLMNALARAWAD